MTCSKTSKLILETERLLIEEEDRENLINCGVYLKSDVATPKALERIGDADLDYYDRDGYCYISYGISEKHRRKRYATEVVYRLTRFCIEKGLIPCIEIHNENKASQGVARKCGYSCDDTSIDYLHDIPTIDSEYIAWAYMKKKNQGR